MKDANHPGFKTKTPFWSDSILIMTILNYVYQVIQGKFSRHVQNDYIEQANQNSCVVRLSQIAKYSENTEQNKIGHQHQLKNYFLDNYLQNFSRLGERRTHRNQYNQVPVMEELIIVGAWFRYPDVIHNEPAAWWPLLARKVWCLRKHQSDAQNHRKQSKSLWCLL